MFVETKTLRLLMKKLRELKAKEILISTKTKGSYSEMTISMVGRGDKLKIDSTYPDQIVYYPPGQLL